MKRSKISLAASAVLALFLATSLFAGMSVSATPGINWHQVNSPNVGSGDNVLNSVFAANSKSVWAVGYYINTLNKQPYARTLIEHGALIDSSGGHNTYSWQVASSPNPGANNYLNSVAAATKRTSADPIWAVGYYVNKPTTTSSGEQALILRYNPLFDTWVDASPNAVAGSSVLNAVGGSTPNDMWAVGYTFNSATAMQQTFILHWNGLNWKPVASPSHAGTNTLTAVTALDKRTAWAVGYYTDKKMTQHPMVLRWNGVSWIDVSDKLPQYDNPSGLYSASLNTLNGNIWMVGTDVLKNLPLAFFFDSEGGKWGTNMPNTGRLTGVNFVTPTTVWTVGYAAGNIETPHNVAYFWDDATGWIANSPHSAKSNGEGLMAISGTASNDIWAVGWFMIDGRYFTQIQHYN